MQPFEAKVYSLHQKSKASRASLFTKLYNYRFLYFLLILKLISFVSFSSFFIDAIKFNLFSTRSWSVVLNFLWYLFSIKELKMAKKIGTSVFYVAQAAKSSKSLSSSALDF